MLATELSRSGYVLFKDDRSIKGGDDWEQALYENLNRSVLVLACLSSDYYNSYWCKVERERALQSKVKIIPILLREVPNGHQLAYAQTLSNRGNPLAAAKGIAERDEANRVVVEGVAEALKEVPPSLDASRAAWDALAKVLDCTLDEAKDHLVREGDGICDWLDKQSSNLPDEPSRLRVAFDVALGLCGGWSSEPFRNAVSNALKRELGFVHGVATPYKHHSPPYWNAVVRSLVEMASTCSKGPAVDAFKPLATELIQRFGADGPLRRLKEYAAVPTSAKFAPVLLDLWVTENRVRRMELRDGSSAPTNIDVKYPVVENCIVHASKVVERTPCPATTSQRPRILRIFTKASSALRPVDRQGPHTWESDSGERILDLFEGVVVWPITSGCMVDGAVTPADLTASPCCVVEERGDTRAVRVARAGRPTTAFIRSSWDRGQGESPVAKTHKNTALSILLPDDTRDAVRKRLFPEDENLPIPMLFERVREWQLKGEEAHLLWTDADLAPEEDFAPMEQE